MLMSNEELKQLSKDTDAFYRGIKGWEDVIYYHIINKGAGAMAAQTQFFNVGRAFAVSNMDRANEFIYPFYCTEIGVQLFSETATAVADIAIVFQHTEVQIVKDERFYRAIPTSSLPGGGGVAGAIDDGTAATFRQAASNGLGNSMWVLPTPIAFAPTQNVRVWLRSDLTAITGIVGVMIMLKGLVARTLI